MIAAPQPFIIATECQKAAEQHGYRRPRGQDGGWASFGSTTARGLIHLAAAGPQGPWFLALEHEGVMAELGLSPVDMPGPGLRRFAFPSLGPLYAALTRVYQLAASLPDAPLQAFQAKVAGLPRGTEAERLVVQRIGQDIFRARLLDYWQGRCPLSGITDTALLRASHIVPWASCTSDAERLDVHNGLLFSALWDAAFDRHLVTFDDQGHPIFSPTLSPAARTALHWTHPIPLTTRHRTHLTHHRALLVQAGQGV